MIRVGFRWLERGSCRHPQVATIKGGSLCPVDFPAMVGVIAHPTRGNLLFLDAAFQALLKDENFLTLLRAEGLDSLPGMMVDGLKEPRS